MDQINILDVVIVIVAITLCVTYILVLFDFRSGERKKINPSELKAIRKQHREHADWIIDHVKHCSCSGNPENTFCLYPERKTI
jgi:hypothetical protein